MHIIKQMYNMFKAFSFFGRVSVIDLMARVRTRAQTFGCLLTAFKALTAFPQVGPVFQCGTCTEPIWMPKEMLPTVQFDHVDMTASGRRLVTSMSHYNRVT